jgi:hypothetical protein
VTPPGWAAPPAVLAAGLAAVGFGILISGGGPGEDAGARVSRLASATAAIVVALGLWASTG